MAIREGAQIKAAREILGWSEMELARRAGVPVFTVMHIENHSTTARLPRFAAIRTSLEAHGVLFTATGVKLTSERMAQRLIR